MIFDVVLTLALVVSSMVLAWLTYASWAELPYVLRWLFIWVCVVNLLSTSVFVATM